MQRRDLIHTVLHGSLSLVLSERLIRKKRMQRTDEVPVGIIGLDTSHAPAFTRIFNNPQFEANFRVTHAYPHGSLDIESSTSRIPRYTEEMREMNVEVVDSIDELLGQVEKALLLTNDGRRHLEQARQVFAAGKTMFIDKPLAASLSDVRTILREADQHQVPVFSASSLRFAPSTQAIANGSIGKVIAADIYSPATLEKTHPDLFWYGIHGVESLFTVMGRGCRQVRRIHHDDMEIVVGEWADGRIGTFRGLRSGKTDYGGVAFGEDGIAPAGRYEGYEHLVREIARFFENGESPVDPEETVEIFAFMEAAHESKRRGGDPVLLSEVMALHDK
ncbi:MAG: Gfo/Idh/MocA family oxidoreductase [Saprospiraceae bacterium]|nr:Gfo/Idh/MocA family oxidoreductase [Saprospiraceae bacterium]